MSASGFLNQKQRHPIALTAAVAINLSAVGALMLAKSDYVKKLPEITWVRHIPLPQPPEPIAEPPQRAAEAPRDDIYIPPRPLPPSGDEASRIDGADVLPPMGGSAAGDGTGTGSVVEPEPKPIAVPILTDATPLPGAAREFQPPYPPQLLRTGVEGKAVVRVLIGADGRVKQVAIISADDPLFADATERQALRKWRFRPATRDGEPVEAWKQLTVRFQIN